MSDQPIFSIVTPNYNMLNYLKRCHYSVQAQDVRKEHIVIDADSTDGSKDWGFNDKNIHFVSEKDSGMYDAINKGIKMANGEFILHLNSDEQLLPDSLSAVIEHFSNNPDIDIIFTNAFLINPDGSFISFRKAYPAKRFFILTDHLYLLTCGTFYRRKIFLENNYFDPKFKVAGDTEFIARLIKKGYKSKTLNIYTSLFTITGDNLANQGNNAKEDLMMRSSLHRMIRKSHPLIATIRRIYKMCHGAYIYDGPDSYSAYQESGDINVHLLPELKSFKWK